MNTIITFAGNLTGDPEMQPARGGMARTSFRVLVNRRTIHETGGWGDAEPTAHNVRVFGTAAVHAQESLGRGDRVVVHGILRTYAWVDKLSGEKRTRVVVEVDDRFGEVGVSLRWRTARFELPTPAVAAGAS